jgi:hypothetical protein
MVLALVLFAGAVAAVVHSVNKTKKPKVFHKTVTMICDNPDCTNPQRDRLFRKKLVTNDPFPKITCPFCKQETAYRAVQCRNCETIFPLIQEGNENPTVDLRCPECNSMDIELDSASIRVEQEEDDY